jgi:hypothetical protein
MDKVNNFEETYTKIKGRRMGKNDERASSPVSPDLGEFLAS